MRKTAGPSKRPFRKWSIGIATVFVLISALFEISCEAATVVHRKRPAGVPKAAVWAGGLDGGSYILCEIDVKRNVNVCTVWNDYSGQIVDQGDFRLLKAGRAATKSELSYRWADRGGRIGLDKGLVLESLDHPLPK